MILFLKIGFSCSAYSQAYNVGVWSYLYNLGSGIVRNINYIQLATAELHPSLSKTTLEIYLH